MPNNYMTCRDLYREGTITNHPDHCCPACHKFPRVLKKITLLDGREVRVCCVTISALHAVISSTPKNPSVIQPIPDFYMTVQRIGRMVSEQPQEAPYIFPYPQPQNGNILDWTTYYLQKLMWAFPLTNTSIAPISTINLQILTQAVTSFADQEDLIMYDAARQLYCLFSEGVLNKDTQFFQECYHAALLKAQYPFQTA
jgi:hypothetical protein